ncbi:MAG: anaerobic ribonucleoside-triphosphate reductase activating protein [Smithellaceae bacterium]|nr:anaerobic ribonucleoside-triphosphate reductase activating protein [Smithellaceae bacterium]
MKIGGFQKVSLNEYPGRIAAVVFTQGCNFRCPYCHNPQLVDPALFSDSLAEDEILDFLERRRGKLDGVSITGGEPLLQADLPSFLRKLKAMGYDVKVDTNGAEPDILDRLIKEDLVRFIAMDVKGPAARYSEIARVQVDMGKIRRSIGIIMGSGIDYEFRTTVVPSLVNPGELADLAKMIKGARRYVLQRFKPSKLLDETFHNETAITADQWAALEKEAARHVKTVFSR